MRKRRSRLRRPGYRQLCPVACRRWPLATSGRNAGGRDCLQPGAALDYLVYVLAAHDSGKFQSGTQFLIEDSQQSFTARSKRYLKGVSDEHAAIIRQFQPYKGCEWTGILRDLSNTDKHRELATVDVDFSLTGLLTLTEHGLEVDAQGNPIPMSVGVYLKGPALVQLPDGRPLVDTLRELETQVGLVLAIFAYEFPSG